MKYNQSMASILAEMNKVKKEQEGETQDPIDQAKKKIDKIKKVAILKKQMADIQKSENSEIDEGKMSQMHMMMKQKKTPEQIAKALKLDLNTVKALMKEAVDPQDTGGAAEVDMIMNQVTQMRHFLDGIEKMVQDDGDVEEWVQGKITKATDYLKTAYSYKTGEKNEALDKEDEPAVKKLVKNLRKGSKTHAKQADELEKDLKDDVNEATVTIKSFDTKTGLDRQAEKQMNAVAQRAGAKVKKSGNNVYKVTGDGKQLSKFMANIDQIDGTFMTEESEFMTEFTSSQIKRLKKEYEPLRGVHHTELQPARFTQLSKMMQRMGKPQLQALVKADIPVLSSAAKASLVVNHGMKFSSIKEELIPYLEVFPLDENRKSKFKSVEPQVIDRIEKMMKGSRAEKDSIANMLNYMMPPEVVDMVRDKLKITAKRGKIRF